MPAQAVMAPDTRVLLPRCATEALTVGTTSTVPIVFAQGIDPVGGGTVASLPRPGGNITGFINIEASLGGKWIEVVAGDARLSIESEQRRGERETFDVLVLDALFAKEVENMLKEDFAHCNRLSMDDYDRRSFPFKLAVHIARLLAPIQ